ncbi:hypothetical protein DFJ73DRAFT_956322 [Zopfochytrium polystomum]|nr:hypothetical protein DFJ73DRAFT_956322 [Zopfochytrium polystomum]
MSSSSSSSPSLSPSPPPDPQKPSSTFPSAALSQSPLNPSVASIVAPRKKVSIHRHRSRVNRSESSRTFRNENDHSAAIPSLVGSDDPSDSANEDDISDDETDQVEGLGGFLRHRASNSDWEISENGTSDIETARPGTPGNHPIKMTRWGSTNTANATRFLQKRSRSLSFWDKNLPVEQSKTVDHTSARKASRQVQQQLLQALDQTADEVKHTSNINFGSFKIGRQTPTVKSYAVIRETYRTQQVAKRRNPSSSGMFIGILLLLIDIRFYYELLLRLLTSTYRVVLFMILDLVSDTLFCAIYVFDVQWAVSHDSDPTFQNAVENELKGPKWLYINRISQTFYVCVAFAIFNLLSLVCRIMFSEQRLRTILSATTFIDIITSLPFLVAWRIPTAQYLYIPFFLRSTIIVSRLKAVLRLRGATSLLNFTDVKEKLVILIMTILSIIYVGMCLFQYVEFRFGTNPANWSFSQSFYFIIVTLATVGYGDVSASSEAGRIVVIFVILVSIILLPTLISSLANTISAQSGSNGSYKVGKSPFVVIMGEFDTFPKVLDVMETFLDEEQGDEAVALVFLARNPPPPSIKAVIQQSLYQNRITYLVGSGLNSSDFERSQIRSASAVYILADRGAANYSEEDERNTVRAWAVDDFSPQRPLYISNLLPETEAFQETTATAAICVDDLKQFVLGLSVLYSGAASFLINLLHKYSPPTSFDSAWKAQYGDGVGNELYCAETNAVFVGRKFLDVAYYLFREFQVILIGIKADLKDQEDTVHLLNPGASYYIREGDILLLIAQSPAEVNSIGLLTTDEFLSSLKHGNQTFSSGKRFYFQAPRSKPNPCAAYGTLRTPPRPSRFETLDRRHAKMHVSQPKQYSADRKVPLCHLLDSPAKKDDVLLKSATHFSEHVLVCTGTFEVFKFVATLRAAHLGEELRPIVFLSKISPAPAEMKSLLIFPAVYFVSGDPKKRRDLIRGGLLGASKVVILSQSQRSHDDDFEGGGAIMVSHLVHSIVGATGRDKCVIVDLPKRMQIKYLRTSPSTHTQDRTHGIMKKHLSRSTGSNEQRTIVARTRADHGLDYLYLPLYAAGRVVVASMLDCMLFQLLKNPSVLDVFKLFCGVRTKKEQRYEMLMGVEPSFLCQIYVPSVLVPGSTQTISLLRQGQTFGELFRELTLNNGLIPLGLYRDTCTADGNTMPFVFTNPLSSIVLRETDLVFALSPKA